MCSESEEELWIDDLQPIMDLRNTVHPFLARPIVEIDPILANSIQLHSVGKNRFEVIRLVHDWGGLSLQEAKAFVDQLPQYLRVDSIRDAASAFESAGADVSRPPDEDSSVWTTYRIDRKMFESTRLELSEDVELWAHVLSSRGGARGTISVLPKGHSLPIDFVPAKESDNRLEIANAFSGDGSLESYWQASILFRELDEVGAEWHGVYWGAHSILEAPPDESLELQDGWLDHAEVLRQRYASGFKFSDLRPRVKISSGGQVWVDFFTLNPVGTRTIIYHSDKFYERYLSNPVTFTCAEGGRGYVH